ncbi:MAG: UDP-N-acetylmuramate dehydrogenase [bacterium]
MKPKSQIQNSKSEKDGVALCDYTTFRLGGPCKSFVTCETPDHLLETVKQSPCDFILIGGGSNLLVSDRGVNVLVIRYASARPRIQRNGVEVIVSGSTMLDDLAAFAVEQGLDGLVYCTGIPGTVGGAIAGNAGAFGEQIGDRLVSVDLLDRTGAQRTVKPDELGFAYRRSRLQETGEVVVAARFRFEPVDRDALSGRRREILNIRAAKHPDWRTTRTAGSFFKNIERTSKAEHRQAAGWFLEQAGAKDLRVGGARVYEKHANIIVADLGCTASDVLALSEMMAQAVRTKFGFDLQREVRLLGYAASS